MYLVGRIHIKAWLASMDEVGDAGLMSRLDGLSSSSITALNGDLITLKDIFKSNSGTFEAWEVMVAHPLIRKDIISLKSVSKILGNSEISSIINNSDLQIIVQNLAAKGVRCRTCLSGNSFYRYLDQILEDIEYGAIKFRENYTSAIVGFKQGGSFAEGAIYVADGVRRYEGFFPPSTTFEFTEVTLGGVRRVDVRVGNTFYEFKSVDAVPPINFIEQFAKDLSLNEVTELSQLKWWFDKKKLVGSLPKDNFMEALENMTLNQSIIDKFFPGRSNVPLSDLLDLIDNSFNNIFSLK